MSYGWQAKAKVARRSGAAAKVGARSSPLAPFRSRFLIGGANYTPKARDAGIHGVVEMEAVVNMDGKVGLVRVVKSLDPVHGLDDEAVKALKKWRFKPGTRSGKPVAVLVTVEMTFTLRKR